MSNMAVPAITIIAAWCSLVTCARSTWDLSRMIRKKFAEAEEVDNQARVVLCNLREAHRYGLINDDEFSGGKRATLEARISRDRT